MADKIPVKAIYSGNDVTSLGEYVAGDTINASYISNLPAGLPAVGADGNVLTSDGTNWASEAPAGGAGGGVWTTSTSGTFSSNSDLVVNVTKSTRITMANLELNTTANLNVRLRESGADVSSAIYGYVIHTYRESPADESTSRSSSGTNLPLNPYVTNIGSTTSQAYIQITIMGPEDSTHDTIGYFRLVGPESSDTVQLTYGALQFKQASVVDGFKIYGNTMVSGNYIIEELG